MKMYKHGLIYGRFQPFHNGHLYLLREALKKISSVTIGIGSSNIHDKDNPFTFKAREEMLEKVILFEDITQRVTSIVALPDIPDDDMWLNQTLEKIGKIDVVVGNNKWTNDIFENVGIDVMRVPFLKRYILEGLKIRELLNADGVWQKRVPPYLVNIIVSEYQKIKQQRSSVK